MFKEFLNDSFFYAKKYYAYIFGLIALNMIISTLSIVPFIILWVIFALLLKVDLQIFTKSNYLPNFSLSLGVFFALLIISFIVWMFLLVVFLSYPMIKTMIEVTRDKDITKRPFNIFFNTIKEKNFNIGLKMVALRFLLVLIIGTPVMVGVGCLVAVSNVSIGLLKGILIVLGVLSFLLMIYIYAKLIFSQNALIDKDIGVIESMKLSVSLTKERVAFVLGTVLYMFVIEFIFQIPSFLVSTFAEKNQSFETTVWLIMAIVSIIIYFVAIPYIIILQYLPYNILLKEFEKKNEHKDYVLG